MAGNLGEKICVTRTDLEALLGLVEARRGLSPRDQAHLDALEQELGRAEVVEPAELPRDVVSLRSTVRVKDLASGQVRDYTLVPPREADVAAGGSRFWRRSARPCWATGRATWSSGRCPADRAASRS